MEQKNVINHQQFWDYVSKFQGEADIKDVFAKFASENNMSAIASKLVWSNVIKDIEALFDPSIVSKYADITVDPDGTAHITSPSPAEESTPEEGISNNSQAISNTVQQQTTQPQVPVQQQAPQQAPNSTIFNRL